MEGDEPKVISITQLLSPTSINAMKLHYSPFGKPSKADGEDASLTRAISLSPLSMSLLD